MTLLILSFGTILGQGINKVELGLEASPSITSLRGNDVIDKYHHSKIAYSVGISLQYNFTRRFSLHANLGYENKGSKVEAQLTDNLGNPIGISKGHTNFEYLIFPILARASFGKEITFFVNVGPYISYLLRQTNTSKVGNSPSMTLDNTYNDKRFDIGISSGLGISIPLGHKFKFSIEARDNLGFYNISAASVSNNGSIKTNSFNFLVGLTYKFHNKKK